MADIIADRDKRVMDHTNLLKLARLANQVATTAGGLIYHNAVQPGPSQLIHLDKMIYDALVETKEVIALLDNCSIEVNKALEGNMPISYNERTHDEH